MLDEETANLNWYFLCQNLCLAINVITAYQYTIINQESMCQRMMFVSFY